MRKLCWYTLTLLIACQLIIPQCEARGGRGRGGGSFGSIFGGWRKYKKPATNVNSRRTTNGSPMHTTVTKSMNSGSNSGAAFSNMKQQSKPQASYPKQQMPYGGNAGHNGYSNPNYGSYYGNSGAGAAHLPPGSHYYPNTAAIPQGAIYYAQPPQRSGTGDFLMGMMTGHMVSNMMFGPRHHIVYQQYPQQTSQNNPRVVVVNNGEATILNDTTSPQFSQTDLHYWPTDSDTPLEPFNISVTLAEAMQPGKEPIYQRVKFNNFHATQMTEAAAQQPTTFTSSAPPVNGLICMPILLNETDPNDLTKILQVERTLCFPAPPPPSEALIEPARANCVTRTFIEADPNDPSKTIEVPKEICTTTTTTLVPPQVAGEIGEVPAGEVKEATTTTEDVNRKVEVEQEEKFETNSETSTEGKFIRSLTTKSAA